MSETRKSNMTLRAEEFREREAASIRANLWGIIWNIILFAVKILAGLLANSLSVISDAINNLSDALSNIVGYYGVKLSTKPSDKEHPFGHGRLEYIAALVVSFLVINASITLFRETIGRMMKREALDVSLLPVLILIVSLIIKIGLCLYNFRLGKHYNSQVLLAVAKDARNDIIATFATLVSLLLFAWKGWNIDAYLGFLVAILVLRAGIEIAKDAAMPLLGEGLSEEDYNTIRDFIRSYDGIIDCHDLIVHDYGPANRIGSVDVELPSDLMLEEAHEIVDRIERDCQKNFGIRLVIHTDPISLNDTRKERYSALLTEKLREYDPQLSWHDFRYIREPKRLVFLFDIVVPTDYPEEKIREILRDIPRLLHEADSRIHSVVTVDKNNIAYREEA